MYVLSLYVRLVQYYILTLKSHLRAKNKNVTAATAVDSEEYNSFDGTSHWEFVVANFSVVLRYYKEFLIFPFNYVIFM